MTNSSLLKNDEKWPIEIVDLPNFKMMISIAVCLREVNPAFSHGFPMEFSYDFPMKISGSPPKKWLFSSGFPHLNQRMTMAPTVEMVTRLCGKA
jgi:hypothetical protein